MLIFHLTLSISVFLHFNLQLPLQISAATFALSFASAAVHIPEMLPTWSAQKTQACKDIVVERLAPDYHA